MEARELQQDSSREFLDRQLRIWAIPQPGLGQSVTSAPECYSSSLMQLGGRNSYSFSTILRIPHVFTNSLFRSLLISLSRRQTKWGHVPSRKPARTS